MGRFNHVKGFDELDRYLEQLPVKLQKNIMRGAMRAGGVVVANEAKATVSVASGLLRDGIKVSTGAKGTVVHAKVKVTGKHAFLARWVEYGTAAHYILPKNAKVIFFGGIFAEKIQHPGASARPFMRPALDRKAMEAVMAVGQTIRRRLTRSGLETADDVELEVS